MIKLFVNGRVVSAPVGSSILDVCKVARLHVPTLCYHPRLRVVATCRVCMVQMQPNAQTPTKLVPACATAAQDGMIVETQTQQVREAVQSALRFLRCRLVAFKFVFCVALRFLLLRHPNECITCDASGKCEFQSLCHTYEATELLPSHHHNRGPSTIDASSHAVLRDMSKCILCSRCVRVCSDVQGMNVLGIVGRVTVE
jgi:NADH dehydrogenase/NADH:ubiquinone oxidoreductase subunit G